MRKIVLSTVFAVAASMLTLWVASAGAEPVQQGAATITNGSFTEPNVGDGAESYRFFGKGSTGITGWTVYEDSVDVYGWNFADVHSGAQALTLNGTAPGGVEQSVQTKAGRRYQVTFSARQDTWNGCQTNINYTKAKQQFRVGHVDNAGTSYSKYNLGSPSAPQDATDSEWTDFTYTFTASERITYVRFESQTGGPGWACGPMITDITIDEV